MDEIEQFLHGRREAKEDDMKEIKLTKGAVTFVDDADFEELSKHNWYCNDKGYAKRTVTIGVCKRLQLYMHTAIMGKIEGLELDHINGIPLDNRRENLRHVTRRQNIQNMTPYRGCTSQYKGVWWNENRKKWISQIMIDGKPCYLGGYASERDAAWVYNVWAESFFGQYARLNII